jgi:hypothetical protein
MNGQSFSVEYSGLMNGHAYSILAAGDMSVDGVTEKVIILFNPYNKNT